MTQEICHATSALPLPAAMRVPLPLPDGGHDQGSTNIDSVASSTLAPIPTGADIVSEDSAIVFRRLRSLKRILGPNPNKHDLAITLIGACISEGWDTRSRIVGTLRTLGLNHSHVVLMLAEGTGSDQGRHRWERDGEGRYRLHPAEESVAVS